MCGIFGITKNNQIDYVNTFDLIGKSWELMKNRGPDGKGGVIFNNDQASYFKNLSEMPKISCHTIFTHRRLSIIDLSQNASQPMHDKTKRFWITYNGEIYNYKEIRKELISHGSSFKTKSDTEVILEAWSKWGPACLEKFVGMFAFSIYDMKDKKIFLVRDRVGIKPLYYVHNSNGLAFASEQATLLGCGVYNIKPNWDGILSGIFFRGALRPNTVYDDIYALKPGHYAVFENNQLKHYEFWDLMEDQASFTKKENLIKGEKLLNQVIERTMISDVPVASLMSGGIDSSTMSVISSKKNKETTVFTLGWDEKSDSVSEIPFAKKIAKKHNLNHEINIIDEKYISKNISSIANIFEEPIGMLEPHYPIAQSVNEKNFKVLLNGLGPDEMLGGYKYYKILNYWKWIKKVNLFQLSSFKNNKLNKILAIISSKSIPELYVNSFGGYLWHDPTELFESGIVNKDWKPVDAVKENFPKAWSKIKDPIRIFNYLDLKIYIGTHHNHTSDKFLMHKSIEGRFPYLDHKWLEFCYNLPSSMKIEGSKQKLLLRDLSTKVVGNFIINNTKKGFLINPKYFLNNKKTMDWVSQNIKDLSKRAIIRKEYISSFQKNSNSLSPNKILYLAYLENWLKTIDNQSSKTATLL